MGDRIPHGDSPIEIRRAIQRLQDTYFDESSDVNHDETTGFVAEEHIDHSAVSIIAGTGLSGGGTLEADRTLNLSHLGIESLADPDADRIVFWDESANAAKWLSLGASLQITDTILSVVAGSVDHGGLTGLADDDHTQYHNNTRGDARYYTETEHINTSAGAADAGKPIILDAAGHIDATMLNDGDIDHGSIGGLTDDDHTQYLLANGTRALSGNLTVDAAVTIDGRDISVDGTKLDTVETNADVTDATNVAAAGAAMAGGAFHDGFSDYIAAEHLFLPNTITNVLSDHNLAAHTALGLFDSSDDVDHNATTNYVAAEHVSLPNTIANVLSDHDLAAHTALGLFDSSDDVDHNATTNYVANEHIDWTAASDAFYTTSTGRFGDNVGIGETSVVGSRLYSYWNAENSGDRNIIRTEIRNASTSNGSYILQGIKVDLTSDVDNSITNSGTCKGSWIRAVHSGAGTTSSINAIDIEAGISSGAGIASRIRGVKITPYIQSGTVSTFYGLYFAPQSGAGTASTAYSIYDNSDFEFVKVGNKITLIMGSSDAEGLVIDGTSNDLTSAATSPRVMKVWRDINYGTGNPVASILFDFKTFLKHTAAELNANTEVYTLLSETQNDGTVVNKEASNHRLYQGNAYLIDDNGTYDSQSTGTLQAWNWASRNIVDNDCTFSDTGGNNPTNQLIVRCVTAETNVQPTLSSGTLWVTNIAFYASVIGSAVGDSTGYGIYINAVTGHDANYGIWDASGADWVLDGDNQKIRLGETQGDFDLFSDGTDAEIDATGDIYLNAGATIKLGNILDMNNNNLTNPGTGHDAFTDFVANEHIDHSGVSVSAGTGLTGGGDLTTSRTISLSHLGLEDLSDPDADKIAFWDDSESAFKWLTLGTNLSITDDTINAASGSCDYGNLYSNSGSVWSLSSATWTQVPYATAGQESGANARGGSDDDIVIATAGVYLITCTMSMRTVNSANVGTLFLQIKKNDGAADLSSCASSSHFDGTATRKVLTAIGLEALEENDTIEAWCTTDNGTARNFYVEHFSFSVIQID